MKWVEPSYKLFKPSWDKEEIFKNIEGAGRNCYLSEPKEGITPEQFTERLIKSGHLSPLEFGICYLHYRTVKSRNEDPTSSIWDTYNVLTSRYKYEPHSYFHAYEGKTFLQIDITTNYRVLYEHGWLEDLQFLSEPTKNHEIFYTVKFDCEIGTSREALRHRKMSFAETSTRYCNYSKDKFGHTIQFIKPSWFDDRDKRHARNLLEASCIEAEEKYMQLIEAGCIAQEARAVLPLCTKTSIFVCGSYRNWHHFFDLRALGTTGAPHPDMKRLAYPLMEEMVELHDKIRAQITEI